ncbi:hypothetical protein NG895_05185 [Aeoliella sp. ICT_H6.2]|uniref:DUF2069 domain-containing protein n=1 Tax=Aeoliella straminimaris TaxID=2954799 RepID=A0A9X2F7V6_9BACT|nr:hypothetical protein [Aeoliella straminimaris]MCO6043293.1 hypothetical protein [Aeoliella straminimaris]
MPAPRFTLRRLLIGVTLFCVVMGLAAIFPYQALIVGWILLPLLPALAIAGWALAVSNKRWRTLVILTPSVLFSFLLVFPALGHGGDLAHLIGDCMLPTAFLMWLAALVDSAYRNPNRWPPG